MAFASSSRVSDSDGRTEVTTQDAVAEETTAPLLQMVGISKSFPGVQALKDVSLTLHKGEVLALLGENGAGKSTLIKMLGGAIRPDAGSILIDGEPMVLDAPIDSIRAGIGVIYQEFNLIPGLNAVENIFLGREASSGFVRRKEEQQRARKLFEGMGVTIPLNVACRHLSIAQQQLVEIAKTLAQDVRILVMDEPSAALTPSEVERLFHLIRELKSQGIGIIYISHRLDEIFEIADSVTVLRDGEHIQDSPISQLTRQRIIELMVGRSIQNEFPKQRHSTGEPRLQVSGLCRGHRVKDVSFHVCRGEVLGITGLVGAGRTETVRLIFGADPKDSGSISLDGREIRISNPRDAVQAGICLLTEDRKGQGLVLQRSVLENFGLASLHEMSVMGFVRHRQEREAFAHYVDLLRIRIPSQQQPAKNLSGGNQQKVVLARWLQRNAEVIIFDEPTRGIDVGAKHEIYLLINQLAAQGKSIVMVSSELPEVIGMSDRILVMHQGKITGEIDDPTQVTQEQIMALAVG